MLSTCSITVAAVCILFLFCTPCFSEDNTRHAAGGIPIGKEDYLWFSAILQGREFICSGALISPQHVITADHCLYDRSVNKLSVRVGYLCPKPDNCGRAFLKLGIHGYRRDPSNGDVAILLLSAAVPSTFVPATPDVASPSFLSRIKKGDGMLMVGAGRDGTSKEVAEQAETLLLQLEYDGYKQCRDTISNKKLKKQLVSKSTICSTSNQGSPCQGDSGSAIIINDDRVGNVIVAIHNYGPRDCSGADENDLFGHVAVSKVSDFVVSVVCFGNNNGNGDDKKETWCPPTSLPPSSPPTTVSGATPSPATCTYDEESCAPFITSTSCAPFLPEATVPAPSLAPTPVFKADSLRATLLHDFTNKKPVYAVAFDATSSRLASAGFDKRVKVWDPSNGGSPLMNFKLNALYPESLAFDPTGGFLAVDDGNNVVVLDVSDTNDANKPRQVLTGQTAGVKEVAWHPDGNMLASGSGDKTVRLWNVATGNVHRTFQGHTNIVRSVSFEPQGRYLASSSWDETIRIWDVTSLAHIRTLEGHTRTVWSVAYSPDGTKLASGSFDDTVRIWRASDGSPLAVFSVGSDVYSVAWSSDGHFLVSGSDDGMVRVWDAAQSNGEEALLEWKGHSNRVESVTWSLNGKWIASGSGDTTVKVWEMRSD